MLGHVVELVWYGLMGFFIIQAARAADVPVPAAAVSGDRELAYRELGAGRTHLLLWHGGAIPELTWSRQHSLADEFHLRIPWRRGFAPSVAAARQDWEPDVRDLLPAS